MDESILRHRWMGPFWALFVACCLAVLPGLVVAQEGTIMISGPNGQPVSPEQMKAIQEAQKRGRPQPGGQPQPNPEEKKDEQKKDGEGEKKDKKEEGGDSVKRPDKPPRAPDPRELEVALDKDGRVPPFNFIGQGWPDVMQWLANLSKCSLDYLELPSGYINLTTQHAYPLDEVRDLLNRQLLARGYISVQSGELLSVYKIDKLDPSSVRRVTEDDLLDLKPYDFVKVTFDLPAGMEVDKAKDDIKQVLSPNAKTFPLVTSRRILVIDAVANLRMVSALMNEERMVQDGRVVPKEFVLKHARPEQVIDILYVVLGMDPKSRPTQMDIQLQQQRLQIMAQMQQKGTDVSKMLKQDGPPVYLAYNKQRNSVLVNAPPEQMKVIEQTIAYLDVPFGGEAAVDTAGATAGTGDREMRKYPLTTLDPENFVTTLKEIGGLSPYVEFKTDKKSKLLFALATEADHVKIKSLIADFDGTGRQFEVVWLRRLPADAVASTIFNLMAGQTKDKKDNNQRRYWSPWDDYGNNQNEDEPVQGFGVDADIENNRLLLWANESEMERVRGLLVKLGEIPDGQRQQSPFRLVQPSAEVSTDELLKRLQDAWTASGQNELIIKLPAKPPAEATEDKEKKADPAGEKAAESTKDRSAAFRRPVTVLAQFVQLEQTGAGAAEAVADKAAAPAAEPPHVPAAPTAPAAKPGQAPPVTVTVTEDGRLMLSSADPLALDRMEELIDKLSPPEKRYKVFRLKYISALNMKWNLEDFFADELKGDTKSTIEYDPWYGFRPGSSSIDKGTGLSKRKKLMISWDTPSNTILIANASPSQMQEIEQLIAEYDKPAPEDSVRTRRTAWIKVKYSKASAIADSIKQVYRDLLSSKDKEFDRGGDERQRGQSQERVTVFRYGSDGDQGGKRPTPMKVGFEGALSIGADDVSNMILVSVQEELYPSVVAMIQALDEEAAPKTTVQVHRVTGSVTAEALQKAIDQAMSKPWPGGRPEQQAGQGGRGRGEGGDRRRGDGEGRRDRRRGDGDNNNNNND